MRRSIPATDPPVSGADGIAIDDQGRIYALTEAGVEVVSGADKRTLFIAGGGTLLKIPMVARGFGGRAK